MPQKGEVRHGATESGQWDGSRWVPLDKSTVDNPASFGWLDAVPGLRDVLNLPMNAVKGAGALPDVARGLINQPGATLKGFAGGASEAATPGRLGLLALLTGGATLPAALAAGGGEALAQGTRVATDAPNAPRSLPEAAGNVAEAASVPALAGAIKAVPGAVERLGGTRNVAGRVLGAGFGGYEGYRYGGIPGAIAGAVGGGSLGGTGGGSRAMRGLRAVIGGGAADEAAGAEASNVSPPGVDRYLPNRSGVPRSREVPGFSMPTGGTAAAEPPLPRSVMSEVDRYMPNSGGMAPVASPVQRPRVGLTGDAAPPPYSGPVGRISGKAPTLNAALEDAVNSLRESSAPMEGDAGVITPDVQDILRDQMNQTSPSMQGLQDAIASENDPNVRVGRLLDANPNSALARFRREPDNPFSARVARTR